MDDQSATSSAPAPASGATVETDTYPGVPWNEWWRLESAVAAAGPQLTVSLVIPAFQCQNELERTLGGLAAQTYPTEQLQIIVVDDGSDPPLRVTGTEIAKDLAADVRLLRQEYSGFGAGRARHAGAELADGDLLLFLDADLVADAAYVEAHARWHAVSDHLVTLGRRTFVSFDGVSPAHVRSAIRDDGDLAGLLAGRGTARHEWIEKLLEQTQHLTAQREDLFRAVVGAGVGVRREFYERTRGFPGFGLRGVEDTVFGWRLFTAGAVLVPLHDAHTWHQGERTFDRADADAMKRARAPRMGDHLPQPPYRRSAPGRSYAVPRVHVTVTGAEVEADRVIETIDSLLAGTVHDLHIQLDGVDRHPEWQLLRHTFDYEPRVTFDPHPYWRESATLIRAKAGCVFAPRAVSALLRALERREVAALYVVVRERDTEGWSVEVLRTRAQQRAEWLRRHHPEASEYELVDELFAGWWEDGDRVLVADCAARAAELEAGRLGELDRDELIARANAAGTRPRPSRRAGLQPALRRAVHQLERIRFARPVVRLALRWRRRVKDVWRP